MTDANDYLIQQVTSRMDLFEIMDILVKEVEVDDIIESLRDLIIDSSDSFDEYLEDML